MHRYCLKRYTVHHRTTDADTADNERRGNGHHKPPHDVMNRRPRVLLGVTGSVAAVKGPKLALRLAKDLG